MKYILIILFSLLATLAQAQTSRNPCYTTGAQSTQGIPNCIGVGTSTPFPVTSSALPPSSAVAVQGNGSGTTGAVVGTLAAATGKFTYLCDFDVSAAGTGLVGPVTIAGLLGGSKVYQLTAPASIAKSFSPCLQSSAVNTAITITTTADATATAVNVNSSGLQQ